MLQGLHCILYMDATILHTAFILSQTKDRENFINDAQLILRFADENT